MSDEHTYDLLILGGGMSYVGAIRAAQLGMKVAIVERDKLGGTCLNRGCIPSKALLETADLLHRVKELGGEFGLTNADGIGLDPTSLGKRRDAVVDKHVRGVEFLMKKNAVTVLRGNGVLTSPTSVTGERRRVRRAGGHRHRPHPGHRQRAATSARPEGGPGPGHRLGRGPSPRSAAEVGHDHRRRRHRRGVGEPVRRPGRRGPTGRVHGPHRPARGSRRQQGADAAVHQARDDRPAELDRGPRVAGADEDGDQAPDRGHRRRQGDRGRERLDPGRHRPPPGDREHRSGADPGPEDGEGVRHRRRPSPHRRPAPVRHR